MRVLSSAKNRGANSCYYDISDLENLKKSDGYYNSMLKKVAGHMHLQYFSKIYTNYGMFLNLSLNERFCSYHWIERLSVQLFLREKKYPGIVSLSNNTTLVLDSP